MPGKRRVVVADLPAALATLRNALGDDVEFLHATTIDSALAAAADEASMIVCGIHFDDSRMFDLLRLVKADARCRSKPFLCFRDLPSELARTLIQSLEISCKALGADAFVDLYTLKQELGVERADTEFRRILLSCLRQER